MTHGDLALLKQCNVGSPWGWKTYNEKLVWLGSPRLAREHRYPGNALCSAGFHWQSGSQDTAGEVKC